MRTGDIYKMGGSYYLVGDINESGGRCDCCSWNGVESELIGNLIDGFREDDWEAVRELLGKLEE